MQHRNSNSSRRLSVLIVLALSVMLMPTAFAQKANNFNIAASQSRLNFELHNETGYEITEVYVSPNTTDDWQEDVLGQDTLANHESVNIKFSRSKQDYWDLKVVFKGGKESVWYKFDLSQITDITISFRNGKAYSTTKNGG
jgi:hypothetical protein